MTAISTLSTAINLASGGGAAAPQRLSFTRVDRTQGGAAPVAPVQGRWTSLWGMAGYPAGVDVSSAGPGAAAVPTNSTNGTLKQTNPGGGRQLFLSGFSALSSQAGSVKLYDRLYHVSGLSGTTTTAQTCGAAALTRYTGGVGNQIWIEIYVAVGATATTITASYTNQSGTSGKTTVAVAFGGAGNSEAGRMIQLPLAAGDTGVQSVQSVTVLATTGTAGDFGVTIIHPLAEVGISNPGTGFQRDLVTGLPSMPEIVSNAALSLMFLAGATTAPFVDCLVTMLEN